MPGTEEMKWRGSGGTEKEEASPAGGGGLPSEGTSLSPERICWNLVRPGLFLSKS